MNAAARDEAVHRLREESRRRVERRRCRSGFSWCMLASFVGGISFAAMNAREARMQERAELAAAHEARTQERAAASQEERKARIAEACAKRALALTEIDDVMAAVGCEEPIPSSPSERAP